MNGHEGNFNFWNRTMKPLVVFALLLWTGPVLAVESNHLSTPAGLLRYVDTTDGISRAEANDIAQAYFMQHVGCGSYAGISERLRAWAVEGQFGYSGEPIKDFLIDKQTGAIMSSVGPSYAEPKDMLSSLTQLAEPVANPD